MTTDNMNAEEPIVNEQNCTFLKTNDKISDMSIEQAVALINMMWRLT